MENKRLYGLLCCLHRQMSRDNHKLFSEYGITHVQMHAMVFIQRETMEGRRVCQKDIEKQVYLRASAMSTMLTNLEKSGFIVRTVSEGDARTKYVTLTEKGKNVCLKNKLFMEKCDGIVQSALTEEEQETFKNLLLKIMAETEKEVKND
ncbi:MAG: winged helix DNA-binding protein [Clostridia bacterium]|nr:winged helix DNA-binding protein [Clostridia bacterium]